MMRITMRTMMRIIMRIVMIENPRRKEKNVGTKKTCFPKKPVFTNQTNVFTKFFFYQNNPFPKKCNWTPKSYSPKIPLSPKAMYSPKNVFFVKITQKNMFSLYTKNYTVKTVLKNMFTIKKNFTIMFYQKYFLSKKKIL